MDKKFDWHIELGNTTSQEKLDRSLDLATENSVTHLLSRSTMEKIAKKFELLDIPRSELAEIRYLVENKHITKFGELVLHIMKKFNSLMPEHIAMSIGGHMNPEDPKSINWDAFLQILEEEVSIKDKLYNQMNFGSNKILMQQEAETDLSEPPRSFFYQDYQINQFKVISDSQGAMQFCLMVVNNNSLAITDLEFNELICRIYFERDFKAKFKEELRKKNAKAEKILKEQARQQIKLYSITLDESYEDGDTLGINHTFDVMKYSGLDTEPYSLTQPDRSSIAKRHTVDTRRTSSRRGIDNSQYRNQSIRINDAISRPSVRSNSKKSLVSRREIVKSVRKGGVHSPAASRKESSKAKGNDDISIDESRRSNSIFRKSKGNYNDSNKNFQITKMIPPGKNLDSLGSVDLGLTPKTNSKNSIRLNDLNEREFMLPSTKKRLSTLGYNYGNKTALDHLRLETLFSKISQVKEEDPEARRKTYKLFTAFKSLVAEPGAGLPELKNSTTFAGYEEGDSFFDEVDLTTMTNQDIAREYHKKLMTAKVIKQVNDFQKHAKTFKRNLQRMDYQMVNRTVGMDPNASKSTHNASGNKVSGSSIDARSRSYDPTASSSMNSRANVLTTKRSKSYLMDLEDIGFSPIRIDDPFKLKNYKTWHEKPKNNADLLTCVSIYYWKKINMVFVGFLTRELSAFSLEYKQEYYLRKSEEVVLDTFCNQMCCMRSEYKPDMYFMLLQVGYNCVQIYNIPADYKRSELLKSTLSKKNMIFSVELSFNPKIKLLPYGFVVINEEKIVQIYKQCDITDFHKGFEVALYLKHKAVTVKTIDYSSRLGLVAVGTTHGDIYVIDCEVNRIAFKYHKYKVPVVECKICEILKCLFCFWENGKFCFFDLLNFEVVQEFSLFSSDATLKMNRKATWSYFPPIDEDMESLVSTSDFFDESTRNRLAQVLEERFLTGRYYVYFGNSSFTKFSMKIDKELQFNEIVSKIKMMERKGQNLNEDSLFGHEISKVIVNHNPQWKYFAIVEGDQSIILVNDQKLMIYLNYIERLIVRYSLLQIKGEIIRIHLISKKQLFIANSYGKAIIYNLVHMHPVKEFDCKMEKVIFAEPVFKESFDMALFQMPNEVYVILPDGKNKAYVEPNLRDLKYTISSQTTSSFMKVLEDAQFIYLILEGFKIDLILKKSMRMLKEIDLLDTQIAPFLLVQTDTSRRAERDLLHAIVNNSMIYMQLSDGHMVMIHIDPQSINDFRVFHHKFEFDLYRFAACIDNSEIYILRNSRIEGHRMLPFCTERAAEFSLNDYSPQRIKAKKMIFKEEIDNLLENEKVDIDQGTRFCIRPIDSRKKSEAPPKKVTFDLKSDQKKVVEFSWKEPLDEQLNCYKITEIVHIHERNLIYMHPRAGHVYFYDVQRRSMRQPLDLINLIKTNKTFDQKRLNENNLMNVRSMLRSEGVKRKMNKN